MWSGGMAPGNLEILHALKCVLGAPDALFRACTQYIYTCKLLSSISGFRSKSTTYKALASGLRSSHVRWLCIICASSIKRKAKEQDDFSRKYRKTNPLKESRLECDWWTDLNWTSPALFGGPLTLGAWSKLPLLPPLLVALQPPFVSQILLEWWSPLSYHNSESALNPKLMKV